MFLSVNEEELFYALSELMGKGLILNEMDKQKEEIKKLAKKGRMNKCLFFEVFEFNANRLLELTYALDKAGYKPENALEGYEVIYPTLKPHDF